MWQHVGLIRTGDGLQSAVARLGAWHRGIADAGGAARRSRQARRLASLITVGLLIARAALRRTESRGGHFRADFPARDDLHLRRHVSDLQPAGVKSPSAMPNAEC
jgi:succinate dehydrogenase/fumarate reductase flavoprotein subunit